MKKIVIPKSSDMHAHLRRGPMLKLVLPFTVRQFRYATVMPNTDPTIYTGEDIAEYRREIEEETNRIRAIDNFDHYFDPVMVQYITPRTTPQMVEDAFAAGAKAGKLYPKGGTTKSEDGIEYYFPLFPIFKKMEEIGMRLLIHGEITRYENQVRSLVFLPILDEIAVAFPSLKIVLEHIPNYEGVEAVLRHQNVAGTITLHHLLETETTIMGHKLKLHNYWKPKPEGEADRDRLCRAALSGHPRFFLGTDSAPHPRNAKETCECGAGGFSAPVTMARLTQFFDENQAPDKLVGFASLNGPKWYGLPPDEEATMTIVKESWTVPEVYEDFGMNVVPYLYGQQMSWKVV